MKGGHFIFWIFLVATFHETVGLEESIENLHLIKEFCEKYFASKPFYFNYEDFLYSPLDFKINKIAFIAELFYWFEIKPIICCKTFPDFKEYIKRMSIQFLCAFVVNCFIIYN